MERGATDRGGDPHAHRTNTHIVRRDGDIFWVRPSFADRGQSIRVCGDHFSVLFHQPFSTTFPLQPEPPGLFARLMLRNFDLHYANWAISIGGRCDAAPSVSARLPTDSLNESVFESVCKELIERSQAFQRELRDRFRYFVGPTGAPVPPVRPGIGTLGQLPRGDVPQRLPSENVNTIRYLN